MRIPNVCLVMKLDNRKGVSIADEQTDRQSHPLRYSNIDMIVVTVFLTILNQMEFHLVQNRKEKCHHDHIAINVKGNGNIVFSVCVFSPGQKNNETIIIFSETTSTSDYN